ncbi:MAG: O-acetyl-ADP-ribose deacetylase [Planctomycetes bacterium]|nr:O-acetyl-ADP-ribose deacetylase [Planctomycetota bacterium]
MPYIRVLKGDITKVAADAIVNAANESLLGGGGVDGAIHRAAGPQLLEECQALGGCPTGQAKVTRGHALPARWVIHTVGPIWKDGQTDEPRILGSCYRRSLDLAREHGARSVAFPAISCGIYGYPIEDAARVAVRTISNWLARHEDEIDDVILVCFNETVSDAYHRALAERSSEARIEGDTH